ncbi:MAG: tetratricopeptide repeat protein [Bacteroidota bacterium]
MRLLVLYIFLLASLLSCKTTQQATQSPKPQNVVASDPNVLNAKQVEIRQQYVEATTQMVRGDYNKAKEIFESVVRLDPQNHAAKYNLAKLSLAQREYEQAVIYANQAVEGNPENYWYYQILQQAYEERGEYKDAIAVLVQITEKFPDRPSERIHLSELYLKNGQADLAVQELNALEQSKGFSPEIGIRKIALLQKSGSLTQAIEVADQLIASEVDNPRFYQIKYDLLKQSGDKVASISTLEKLLEFQPDNGFALLSLADYYRQQDDLANSDKYLNRALRNPDIEVEGKVYILNNLLNFASQDAAMVPRILKLSRILYQTHPGNAQALAIQGRSMRLNNQPDSARYYLKQSLDLDPTNTNAWQELLESDYESANFAQLYDDADEALELFPNQERILFYYGLGAAQQQDSDAAFYAFNKIIKKGSRDQSLLTQTHLQLASLYQKEGDIMEADQRFEKAIAISPEDANILDQYAYHLALRGERLSEAAEMAQKSRELQPERAAFLITQGLIAYKQGSYGEAVKSYEQALSSIRRPTAKQLEHYGDALYKSGKASAARQQWEKAKQLGALSLDIDKKLREL